MHLRVCFGQSNLYIFDAHFFLIVGTFYSKFMSVSVMSVSVICFVAAFTKTVTSLSTRSLERKRCL